MDKTKILLVIVIITLGIFSWLYLLTSKISKDRDSNMFIFVCPSDREIKNSYDEGSNSANFFIPE
jgi:hypothetical protein